MKSKNPPHPLRSVSCAVHAFNEDGSSASAALAVTLQRLGATVHEGLREGHTHLIWSNAAPSIAVAADLLDCQVVSPLWVSECSRAKKHVPEKEYLVDLEYVGRGAGRKGTRTRALSRPVDLSSSRNKLKRACDKVKRLSEGSTSSEDSCHHEVAQTHSRDPIKPSAASSSSQMPFIPLPTFREIEVEPVLDLAVRRSERLVDSGVTVLPPSSSSGGGNDSEFIRIITERTVFRLVTDATEISALGGAEDEGGSISKPDGRKKRRIEAGDDKPNKKLNSRASVGAVIDKTSAKGKYSVKRSVSDKTSVKGADNSRCSGSRQTRSRPPLSLSLLLSGFPFDETSTLETMVAALPSDPAAPVTYSIANHCTELFDVLVAEDKTSIRTVKVLFALARGLPIVTRDWIFASLDGPADTAAFLHPRCRDKPVGRPLLLLQHKRVVVSKSCSIAASTLEPLIECLGGTVVNRLKLADYVFAEETGKTEAVVDSLLMAYAMDDEDQWRFTELTQSRRVLRVKFLINCIVEGRWSEHPDSALVLTPAPAKRCLSPGRAKKGKPARTIASARVGGGEISPSW